MSSHTSSGEESQLICEFCGFPITEEGQDCLALTEGVCRP